MTSMLTPNIVYSLPYLAVICLLVLLMFVEEHCGRIGHGARLVRQIALFLVFVFVGLRYYVGLDVFMYQEEFYTMPTLLEFTFDYLRDCGFEPGWSMYMCLFRTVFPNFSVFLLFNTLVDVFLLYAIFCRYHEHFVLGLILYLGFYGLVFELEQLRNAKAILLFFLSLPYLASGSREKYYVLNVIALTFHISAIIYLFLGGLLRRRVSEVTIWIVFFVGIFIALFDIHWVEPILSFLGDLLGGPWKEKIRDYMANDYFHASSRITLGFFERMVTYVLLLVVFRKRLIDKSESNVILLNLFLLYFISVTYLFSFKVAATRVSALFVPVYALLYPQLLDLIKRKLNRQILLVMLLVFAMYRTYSTANTVVYRYETVFSHRPYHEVRKLHDASVEEMFK